ncbi:MAG: Asp23/Gls24 family envelope stress response protein [Clostridia bacterium]|nr:Asp23/Gls24 family envelope stress response protein [Clostridia bacterium]
MEENQEVEKKEVLENVAETEVNGIKISDEVVATIASMAASEVSGVYNMSGGLVGGISEMLGKKTKGIKVQVGEKETVIDISLIVEYGARIPDIAWEVQNKVKTQVESMTGLNVVAVNVHVQGVNLPKENKKSMEKKAESIEKKDEEVESEE